MLRRPDHPLASEITTVGGEQLASALARVS